MKKGIHPEYQECTVKCVCGNEFTTRSTLKEISVEICAACHPFFTGQQKLVDSAGRVDRFLRKYGDGYARGAASKGGDKPAEDAKVEKPEGAETPGAEEKPEAEAPAETAAAPETETKPEADN